jgi:UV DNA damage endonuclease
MHPDQFIVLNSPKKKVVKRSIDELCYHADVLDIMGLTASAKIQLHIGGIYSDKTKSIQRFMSTYNRLDPRIKDRLVIENDDTRYHLKDCLRVSKNIGIPVLIDVFHHKIYNNGEDISDILMSCARTWRTTDGILMLDYSQQEPGQRPGKHKEFLDLEQFRAFILTSKSNDFDMMLEIKDKEKSAIKALNILRTDKRFFKSPK